MTKPILIEEGSVPVIKVLLRFMERRWTEAFRAGHIRMGTVEKYRNEYEGQEGGRNDPDEHLRSLFQPDRVTIRVGEHVVSGAKGPIRIRRRLDECSYVLCMTAITDRDLNEAFGDVKLDRRLLGLGDAAVVITDAGQFLDRLQAGIDEVPWLRAHRGSGGVTRLVEYVDFSTYQGEIGPFRKSLDFRYQHEWRMALIDGTGSRRKDHLTLEVGDISDITMVVESESLVTRGIQVEPIED